MSAIRRLADLNRTSPSARVAIRFTCETQLSTVSLPNWLLTAQANISSPCTGGRGIVRIDRRQLAIWRMRANVRMSPWLRTRNIRKIAAMFIFSIRAALLAVAVSAPSVSSAAPLSEQSELLCSPEGLMRLIPQFNANGKFTIPNPNTDLQTFLSAQQGLSNAIDMILAQENTNRIRRVSVAFHFCRYIRKQLPV